MYLIYGATIAKLVMNIHLSKEIQMELRTLTNYQIRQGLASLARALPPKAVLWPMPRGGNVVFAMLQYWRSDLILSPQACPDMRNILLDDIVDTGTTLQLYYDNEFEIASLFVRCSTCSSGRKWEPHYTGDSIHDQDYLALPWEADPKADMERYLERIKEANLNGN